MRRNGTCAPFTPGCLKAIAKDYRLQFAAKPLSFNVVIFGAVRGRYKGFRELFFSLKLRGSTYCAIEGNRSGLLLLLFPFSKEGEVCFWIYISSVHISANTSSVFCSAQFDWETSTQKISQVHLSRHSV